MNNYTIPRVHNGGGYLNNTSPLNNLKGGVIYGY